MVFDVKKYNVNILQFAYDDLYEILNYYISLNPTFAKNLYDRLKAKILELEVFPEKGIIVPELEHQGLLKYRQIIEGNYRAIYSIQDVNIFVHVIIDSRRNMEEVLIQKLQRENRRTTSSS